MAVNGVSNTALLDLTKTTLKNLPDFEFETTLKNPRYHVVNKWFTDDKIELDSGTSIQRNIVLDPSGNAQHVRLYQKVGTTVRNEFSQIDAPWVQVLTRWSVDRREILRNRKKSGYIRLLQSRRLRAQVDLANLLELRAWSTPESANDDLNPYGLPYWLNKVNSGVSSTGDFIGQTIRFGGGTTSTTKGGINGSTTANAHWRNYAFTYDAIDAEFVNRMRRAFHKTGFQSPMIAEDMVKGPMSNFRIYMNVDSLVQYEDLATKQNDNLGPDVNPFQGATTFKRVPILYQPQIDSDTDDPVYGVNHDNFFPYVLEGDWMREDDPKEDVEQPSVFTTTVEGSYQYFCLNVREGGFVGSKVPSS